MRTSSFYNRIGRTSLTLSTMLRTVRLENEHLGNIDQYRVTREVPLPYTYDNHSHESDGDEDDEGSQRSGGGSWKMSRRRASASGHVDATVAEAGHTLGDD